MTCQHPHARHDQSHSGDGSGGNVADMRDDASVCRLDLGYRVRWKKMDDLDIGKPSAVRDGAL